MMTVGGLPHKQSDAVRILAGSDTEHVNAVLKIQAAFRGKKTRTMILKERHPDQDQFNEAAPKAVRQNHEQRADDDGRKLSRTDSSADLKVDFESLRKTWEESTPYCSCWPSSTLPVRIHVYLLFDEPSSSFAAKMTSVFILTCIVLSIAFFMLETLPELSDVDPLVWQATEAAFTIIFTFEYVIRLLVCDIPGKTVCQFLIAPMNVVDLCAILPFYITLMMASTRATKMLGVIRTVRLVRLFRIFKLGRYSAGLNIMMVAMRNSVQALGVLIFFLGIGCVLFSSLVYHVEKLHCPDTTKLTAEVQPGVTELEDYLAQCRTTRISTYGLCCNSYNAPYDFPSVISAFWWTIVTMTTVGFGDVLPRTDAGKIVGTITMLSGILLLALPIALIGAKFQEAFEAELGDQPARVKGVKGKKDLAESEHLLSMSHRLRLMKFGDKALSRIARDLAKDFEDVYAVNADILMFEEAEDEMQTKALDRYTVILEHFQHFSDKAWSARLESKSSRGKEGGVERLDLPGGRSALDEVEDFEQTPTEEAEKAAAEVGGAVGFLRKSVQQQQSLVSPVSRLPGAVGSEEVEDVL